MRKTRVLIDNAFYHVTSRTNDKIRVFENNLGRKIMLITLQDAKDKFHFRLTNFCVMPTHIHLLIQPPPKTNLSAIMQWLKIMTAKRWNFIHGSIDHLWGDRFYSRAVKNYDEYNFIDNYIDQNAVVAGLADTPENWKASGAFYKKRGITGLVDFDRFDQKQIPLLPTIPFTVSNLIPPKQLDHVLHYIGAYAVALDRLYCLVPQIPKLGETKDNEPSHTYLHYYTPTHNYFIYEYDGKNTMYGTFTGVLETATRKKINLADLLKNPLMKLELSN
ncbi:hypothetical protein R84B8_00625 [Treponema sp. R8-4-B8]